METVTILGLIVILIGGYIRYHQARIYAPLAGQQVVQAEELQIQDPQVMSGEQADPCDYPQSPDLTAMRRFSSG
jgi:hypothetical protein